MLKIFSYFKIQKDHVSPTGTPNLINRKKKNLSFAIPADQRLKIKESKNMDKYLDLARELKEFWNMRVTVLLVVVVSLGTVNKVLEKKIRNLRNDRNHTDNTLVF